MPEISILLPTLREGPVHQRIREFAETNTGCDYEIVVVSPFPVAGERVVHVPEGEPRGGIAATNLAYEHSSSPFVAYWSDDASPGRHCLRRMLRFMERRPAPFLGSFWVRNRRDPRLSHFPHAVYGRLYAWWGCLSRETVQRAGGLFDPAYRSFWADPDLGLRVWECGGRVASCPRAAVLLGQIDDTVKSSNYQKWNDVDAAVFFERWHERLGPNLPRIAAVINGPIPPRPGLRLLLRRVGFLLRLKRALFGPRGLD